MPARLKVGRVRQLYHPAGVAQDLKRALFIKATDVAFVGRVADPKRSEGRQIPACGRQAAPATNLRKGLSRNGEVFFYVNWYCPIPPPRRRDDKYWDCIDGSCEMPVRCLYREGQALIGLKWGWPGGIVSLASFHQIERTLRPRILIYFLLIVSGAIKAKYNDQIMLYRLVG